MAEPSDTELWRGVEHTVRAVLLPAIDDEWARAAAIQLAGLARYASSRPTGRLETDTGELVTALRGLDGNTIVASHWHGDEAPAAVMAAVAAILAETVALEEAVTLDGSGEGDAEQARTVLRTILVRQLDDELAVTSELIPYFRGQIDA